MRKVAVLITCVILSAAAFAVGSFKGRESPHEFTETDCFSCHFTLPMDGNEGEPLRFTDTIFNMCARCHDMTKVVSHRCDVRPPSGMPIPADMPLDENGRMTCVTCHDVHKPFRNPLTGERTYFLRRDVLGRNFCYSCHNTQRELEKIQLASLEPLPGVPREGIISHRPAMDRGHGFASFEVLDPGTELDPLSLACIDCHDEPGDPVKRTSLGVGLWRHAREGIGLSHPVGVDYYRAALGNRDLVAYDELDKRLKLFDGKMGCCTCHDPYIPNDGQALVIGSRDSYQDLCFACHIK